MYICTYIHTYLHTYRVGKSRIIGVSMRNTEFIYLFFSLTQAHVFIAFFREMKGKRKGEREKHLCGRETSTGWPAVCPWIGDQTCNLGMCPDWESNQQTCSHRAMLQPAEPHWPRHRVYSCIIFHTNKCKPTFAHIYTYLNIYIHIYTHIYTYTHI